MYKTTKIAKEYYLTTGSHNMLMGRSGKIFSCNSEQKLMTLLKEKGII